MLSCSTPENQGVDLLNNLLCGVDHLRIYRYDIHSRGRANLVYLAQGSNRKALPAVDSDLDQSSLRVSTLTYWTCALERARNLGSYGAFTKLLRFLYLTVWRIGL